MQRPLSDDFTLMLNRASEGDGRTANSVWTRSYEELHAMATSIRRGASTGGRATRADEPSPTTIIHESFVKTFGRGTGIEPSWDNRAHFFGSVARAMSQFLVDWRRAMGRKKRGGGQRPVALIGDEEAESAAKPEPSEAEEVRQLTPALVLALERLQKRAPEIAEVVWLRAVSGLTLEDTALVLGIAPRTVSKRWNIGRALLRRELSGDGSGSVGDGQSADLAGFTNPAGETASAVAV